MIMWGQNRRDLKAGRYLLRNALTAHRMGRNWTRKVISEDTDLTPLQLPYFPLSQHRFLSVVGHPLKQGAQPGSSPPGPVMASQVSGHLSPLQTMPSHRALDSHSPPLCSQPGAPAAAHRERAWRADVQPRCPRAGRDQLRGDTSAPGLHCCGRDQRRMCSQC